MARQIHYVHDYASLTALLQSNHCNNRVRLLFASSLKKSSFVICDFLLSDVPCLSSTLAFMRIFCRES